MVKKEDVSTIDSKMDIDANENIESIAADFQRRYGDFSELMKRTSKPMFDKFVTTVYEVLRDNPAITYEEFERKITPEPIVIDPPISSSEYSKIYTAVQELCRPHDRTKEDLARKGADNVKLIFRGAGKWRENFDSDVATRKLYCAPDIHQIAKFIETFYTKADAHGINLMSSKIFNSAIKRNEQRDCVSQAHNTFVIYCASDSDVYPTLAALQCAERESKVSLGSFENSPIIKSPRALSDKVIIGGRDVLAPVYQGRKIGEDFSFDKWTELMAARVYEYHENPNEPYWSPGLAQAHRGVYQLPHVFARHVVFKIMRDVLRDVAKRTPEEYLCI
ncbi:MAG TPA: hypothetical protein VJA27_02190 [Patescibacteria group bacterium]|nr:hypothetical protein [Patescibacteria group bacterium]